MPENHRIDFPFLRRLFLFLTMFNVLTASALDFASQFADPPESDRPWVYWWWLDGAASREGITRELEEMSRQGIGGVLLVDAGQGDADTPKGPPFMSDAWRDNFRHAVREAGRLNLKVCVNLCSGWNAGGPWIRPDDAIKHLVTTETVVQGPAKFDEMLPQPHIEHDWYRDIAVLACRVESDGIWKREGLLDLTTATQNGRLRWDVPEGRWTIMRFGCTLNSGKTGYGVSARTKLSSGEASAGWEADPWSAEAMDRHFAATAGKLIEDAGALTGRTFVQVHIDSWETPQPSWTPRFLEEFRNRRGYDARLFLPAMAGRTVDSAEITARFQWDYHRTAADLFAANYFGRLGELARRHGLGQDSESGGPFFSHSVDALQCEGINEVPMGEFWKRAVEPDGPVLYTPEFWGYDTVRQAASAAHIYGRPICAAEAFTSFGEDWIEDPWCLKDVGDLQFCNGLTRMVFHKFTHQAQPDAVPGTQWAHVGTHINTNTTWWDMGHAWLLYLRRCQSMLRRGRYVADLAYYYGENANSFVRSKTMMNPPLPTGFDCDTLNAEVLLTRAGVKDGRLVLPDGMRYRYLVLPHKEKGREVWKTSPPVLRRIAELVKGGLTVIGPKPALQAPGLTDYPACDDEVRDLAEKLWGDTTTSFGARKLGKGRVIWGKTPAEVLGADGLVADLEFVTSSPTSKFDWIHRRDDETATDICFISNQRAGQSTVEIAFRTAAGPPELWDAVTGEIRTLPEFREVDNRTIVPMRFEPRQSFFVVFRNKKPVRTAGDGAPPWERGRPARNPVRKHSANSPSKPSMDKSIDDASATNAGGTPALAASTSTAAQLNLNFPDLETAAELSGAWEISFDPNWGGPEKVTFDSLQDWTQRPEDTIRYYSGKAVYRKTFDLPKSQQVRRPPGDQPAGNQPSGVQPKRTYLDLGVVKNVARISLNGRDMGVVWTAPWRIEITEAVREKDNLLEITVVNLWPNRLIGDAKLPPEKRYAKTNVKTYQGVPLGFEIPGGCKACEYRQKSRDLDKSLLPSGLLGPVLIYAVTSSTAIPFSSESPAMPLSLPAHDKQCRGVANTSSASVCRVASP